MANVSQIKDREQLFSFSDAVATTANANNADLNNRAETQLNATINRLNPEIARLETRVTAIENRITKLENL